MKHACSKTCIEANVCSFFLTEKRLSSSAHGCSDLEGPVVCTTAGAVVGCPRSPLLNVCLLQRLLRLKRRRFSKFKAINCLPLQFLFDVLSALSIVYMFPELESDENVKYGGQYQTVGEANCKNKCRSRRDGKEEHRDQGEL